MPATLQPKNGAANEFRSQADALRKRMINPEEKLTKDEVENLTNEIRALDMRAATVAEFTPDDEIERQGGDELVRRAAPGNEAAEDQAVETEYKDVVKEVRAAFGGPNGYLLSLARRSSVDATPWTERQKKAHKRAVGLHQRVIVGTASDATGGEFLLPLQQVESIFVANLEQPGLFERARRYPVRGRSLRIPLLDQTDAANTRPMAGIAAITIVGEGGEKPEREPQFIQRLLNVYKWAAYTEFGDEMLVDDMTGDMAPTVQQAVGGQIMNEINGYVTIDGSGSSQPLGALHANNAALKVVNRETSMTATINDILEMDARFVDGPNAFWLIHVSQKPAIMKLALSGNTLVTYISDLRSRPVPMLFGKPIVWTHLTSIRGVKGDVALINPDFYAVALRQALTVESSIHYKFRNDITAYRFFARAGGIPIPTGTYSYKSSGSAKIYEVSPFVVLGDDAIS